MATRYQNWLSVMEPIAPALPDSPANNRAKNGVMPKRAAVIWNDEVPLRAYLEKAVEIPQAGRRAYGEQGGYQSSVAGRKG